MHLRPHQPVHGLGFDAARLRGAVLLEVILAMVLFVAAAAVISSALSSSVESVEKQKLRLHASNLAITIASEIQMGLRPSVPSGPTPFEKPFQDWTYQTVVASTEPRIEGITPPSQIEVIIRHTLSDTVMRLAQWVNPVVPGGPNPASRTSLDSTKSSLSP